MNQTVQSSAEENLRTLIESARRLGVEMDESEALQWLSNMAAWKNDDQVTIDQESGTFGHKVSMLDFSPADLAYFREIGKIVEFEDQPGVVETALSLSGSAAQSRIQSYPGDCDYFERVNIIAPTRQQACEILSDLMREKALSRFKGPNYRLIEVKYGNYPRAVLRGGERKKAGAVISWNPHEVKAGFIEIQELDGQSSHLKWDEVKEDPGWCKLDWVVADPVRGRVANASNVLDTTWEAPDGSITTLDGYLDPYFQEVYLDAQSIPIFSKLVKQVSAQALDEYIGMLEHEVYKYLAITPNYGKVAKRMYNIFRLSGKYQEAAYLRELFDEPATVLYQVWSLIGTLDNAADPDSSLTVQDVVNQADKLILTCAQLLDGSEEVDIIRALLKLRDSLSHMDESLLRTSEVAAAQGEVMKVVNKFFYERLTAVDSIREYMDHIKTSGA